VAKFFALRQASWRKGFAEVDPFYADPDDFKHSDSCPTCPKCNSPIGTLTWLPPHNVTVKRIKIDEILWGVFSFVVTEKMKNKIISSGLTGIKGFYPLTIVNSQGELLENQPPFPKLFGVEVVNSLFRADYSRSTVQWAKEPDPKDCPVCGPRFNFSKLDGIFFENEERINLDFFFCINYQGTIFISEKAFNFIKNEELENVLIIPPEKISYREFSPTDYSSCAIYPLKGATQYKISPVGLYKFEYSEEDYQNQLRHSYSQSYEEQYAKDDMREQMDKTVIAEILVSGRSSDFSLGEIVHGRNGQIPYLGTFLTSDGLKLLPSKPFKRSRSYDFRAAFFICWWDTENPFLEYQGQKIQMPSITKMPERIKEFLKWETIE
jgi:hypothetical protein